MGSAIVSQLAEQTAHLDALGDALAIGVTAAGMGSDAGAELVEQITVYANGLAAENPFGDSVAKLFRTIGAAAERTLGKLIASPWSIAAIGGSLAVYSWMSSDEAVQIAAIKSNEEISKATLVACVESGSEECLQRMADAAAQGQKDIAGTVGASSLGTVVFWGVVGFLGYKVLSR